MNASRLSFALTCATAGLLLVLPASVAAQPVALVHDQLHKFVAQPTETAARSGSWSDPGTWSRGAVPGAGARVAIPSGVTVTVDREIDTAYYWVRVDGTLSFQPDAQTKLVAETVVVMGKLEMGTASQPIAGSARLVFRSNGQPLDHSIDPMELTRGLIAMNPVSLYGQPKNEISALATLPPAGATTLTLREDPTGWQVGDELIVAPTAYGQEDVVTVTSISGRTIGISPALKYTRQNVPPQPKIGPAVDYQVHVGNMTRTVVIQTDPDQAVKQPFRSGTQGHVMLMGGGHRIYNAAFVDTGRTTIKPVTDPVVRPDGTRDPQIFPNCLSQRDLADGFLENPRGRYSLHFHNAGPTTAPSHVEGVVVRVRRNMGLKIGIQNHSSHVIGRRIVSYAIDGSHLFTEEGDELGEYTDSLAVHSRGEGKENDVQPAGTCMPQTYPEIFHSRRRDMGFQGAGVWLQGSLVKLDGSIYAGHFHAGVDHSAQGLDLGLKNSFAILVRPATMPDGGWWLKEGRWKNQPYDPNEPLLRVAIPVWILRDITVYATEIAIGPKFTTDLPKWFPRPKNLFKNIFAWNVWTGINSEYSPWGILEDSTFIAGSIDLWGVRPNYRRFGVLTMRQDDFGNWTYRNVRIDGFTDHKNSGKNRAEESEDMSPAHHSRYINVHVNGQPYVPTREACDDGRDNDGDGQVDENCLPEPPHPLGTPPPGTTPTPTPVPFAPSNLRIVK